MIKVAEIAFVAYPVSDINRAKNFYENVLGLSPGEFNHEIAGYAGHVLDRVRGGTYHTRHIECLGALRNERTKRRVRGRES